MFGHRAVLLGSFAELDATWRWDPPVSPPLPPLSSFSLPLPLLSSLLSNSADPASAAALPAHASPADPAGSAGPRRSSSSPGVFGSPSWRGDEGLFPSFPPLPSPCSPPRRELPRRCRAERWPPASPAPSAPGRRARSCGGLPCTRPRSYGGWRGEAPWGPPLPHPSATSSGGLHEAEPARGGIGQASRARADGAARSLARVAATPSCSSRRGRKELPRSARGRSRGRSAGEQGRVRVADAPLRPASVRRTRAAWRAGRGARGGRGRDPCSPSSSGAGHRGGQPTKASRAAALKLRSRPDPGAPPPPSLPWRIGAGRRQTGQGTRGPPATAVALAGSLDTVASVGEASRGRRRPRRPPPLLPPPSSPSLRLLLRRRLRSSACLGSGVPRPSRALAGLGGGARAHARVPTGMAELRPPTWPTGMAELRRACRRGQERGEVEGERKRREGG